MQEPQIYKGATSDGLNVYVLSGQPQDEVWVFDNATMKKIDVIKLNDLPEIDSGNNQPSRELTNE